MIKRILILTTLVLVALNISAQDFVSAPVEITFLGEGYPDWDFDNYSAALITKVSKNESESQEELEEYKKLINAKKRAQVDNAPAQLNTINSQNKTTAAQDLDIGTGFQVFDAAANSTPMDNTIGVSTKGWAVVAVNSLIRYYDLGGTSKSANINLSSFFSSAHIQNGNLLSTNICDPKVMFDYYSKRYIVMAQTCDGDPSNSQILFAFSKTEDPLQGWYYYAFTGNPSSIAGNVWFDYPKIGTNDHDLFITGNFFDANENYKESGIYMIDKTKGMAGGTYANGDALIYSGISGAPFTLVPSTNGRPKSMGNKMYFLSTISSWSASNKIRLYEINGTVQSNPNITRTDILVDPYEPPGDAKQNHPGGVYLSTGDVRGMDAIYVNGMIHFVFHKLGLGSYTEIRYERISKNSSGTWEAEDYDIGATSVELAYPSITSLGHTDNDQAVAILMDFSSSTYYPSVGAMFISHEGEGSNISILKQGTVPMNLYSSGGVTRWGDYSGLSTYYGNTNKPMAVGHGMYGSKSTYWTNWVNVIKSNQGPLDVSTPEEDAIFSKVYPNPAFETWNLDFTTKEPGNFTADIYSVDGRLVKHLLEQKVGVGEHHFGFNKGALSPGTYIIRMEVDGKNIANEKLQVVK